MVPQTMWLIQHVSGIQKLLHVHNSTNHPLALGAHPWKKLVPLICRLLVSKRGAIATWLGALSHSHGRRARGGGGVTGPAEKKHKT